MGSFEQKIVKVPYWRCKIFILNKNKGEKLTIHSMLTFIFLVYGTEK